MKFPDTNHKQEQYQIGGLMLANVASEVMGFDPLLIADDWSFTMGKLAIADDMSEESPEFFLSGIGLLSYLELDTTNSRLVESAEKLLEANITSSSARTIKAIIQQELKKPFIVLVY